MVDMVDTTVAPLEAVIKVAVMEDVDPLVAVAVVVSPVEEAVVLDAVDVWPLQLIIRNKLLLTLQALIPARYQKNITMTKAVRYTIRNILRNPLSMRSMITLPTSNKNTLHLMNTKATAITEKTGNPTRLKAMK